MSKQVKDLYRVLEIEKDATPKDIKKSYRRLSQKYHPDVSKEDNAEEMFKTIVDAYEVLSDPLERERYDEFVKMMKEGKGLTFLDIFNQFHQHEKGAHTPLRGENIEMEIPFTITELKQGVIKDIEYDRYINCETCEGHGYKRDHNKSCSNCKGKGYELFESKTPFGDITSQKTCETCNGLGYTDAENCSACNGKGKKNVPAVIKAELHDYMTNGYKITFTGKGDAGLNGGKNGDLVVVLKRDQQDTFCFGPGRDIFMTIDVPFLTALKGGRVSVELPRGETIKVPIKSGTQNRHQIIIPDEGLYDKRKGAYGNLNVVVNILVPEALSNETAQKIIKILS